MPPVVTGPGVRPVLKAALSIDPGSPYAKVQDGKLKTNLHVAIRISDHAPEADFFGIVGADFADVKVAPSGPEQFVWQAVKCHINRGLPKVTVVAISGTISDGETKVQVSAMPRHIGKLMPADEIVLTRQLSRTFGNSGMDLDIRAQTKVTQLVLALRVSVLHCDR